MGIETKKYNLEFEIAPGKKVKLGGTVDRIDEKQTNGTGITRVIDYKTGRIDLIPFSRASNPDLASYVGEYFNEGKYKAGFQGYYYGFLFQKAHPEKQIKIGIFGLQEINQGIQLLRDKQTIRSDLFGEFEKQLRRKLIEIWDPNVPFSQTQDANKCVFCPYATICSRN